MKILIKTLILFIISFSLHAKIKKEFEDLELFNKVLYLIDSQYYKKVDTSKLIHGAIKGMMDTLDPHSSFLSKDLFEKMKIDTSGEFGGLGLEVTQKDGVIYVISPIDDTPAYKVGIKPGDKIVEINGKSTVGLGLENAVKKMKGKVNTFITLGIIRKGVKGIKKFRLKRELIKILPVKTALIEKDFLYIRLTQFQKNSAKAIKESYLKYTKEKKALRGIVLDLRSNPGGLLEQAIEVSSIFLKKGVVVSTEGRDGKRKDVRYVVEKGLKLLNIPLVVLINGASASASEIVAGALQDYRRAIIMGSESFGKGSVQTVAKIDKENGLKLTIAEYMTPNNRKIQAKGIVPDIYLDEYDAQWMKKNKKKEIFIREKDLKNHLSATIDKDDEKKLQDDTKKSKKLDKVKDEILSKYDPKRDFQVIQAVHYLKSFKIFKAMQN